MNRTGRIQAVRRGTGGTKGCCEGIQKGQGLLGILLADELEVL